MTTSTFGSLHALPLRNGIYKSKAFQGRGVRIVKMSQLFSQRRLRSDAEGYELIELTEKERRVMFLKKDDLLFSRTSVVADGVGKCSLVTDSQFDLTWDSNTIRVRIDMAIACPHFYFYYFNSPQGRDAIKQISGGVSVTTITGSGLAAMHVPTPTKFQQQKIASILSAYDDLIENNTRRIAILEEMARRLYDEWFVRFRFLDHEGMPMVESELGLVPQGWDVVAASQAIQINPTTKVPKDGMKPFLAMNCLSNGAMLIDNPDKRDGNSGSKFRNGDTLFARITPCLENGKTGFVQFLPTDEAVAFGSTEFIVLRSRTLTPEFVYLLARSDPFRENAIKSMSGASGRQRVREACFNTFLIANPDGGTLAKFEALVRPMFKLIQSLAMKNANLRTTRDLLLPKLISGELDVSTLAEPQAETI